MTEVWLKLNSFSTVSFCCVQLVGLALVVMVKAACANLLAMSAYGLVLHVLLPSDIVPDWCFMLQITAVASFGYFIGLVVLFAASWLLSADVHTQRCREWTTVKIFGVSFGNCYLAYGFSQVDNVFRMSSYFAAMVYLH